MTIVSVRVPGYIIGDGAVENPIPGHLISTGLGIIVTDTEDPVRHPEAQELTGVLRQAGHLCALDGRVTAVIMSETPLPEAAVDTEITLHGQLLVEPYLWGVGPLRALLPHGWRTWRVLATEAIAASPLGDLLARLDSEGLSPDSSPEAHSWSARQLRDPGQA